MLSSCGTCLLALLPGITHACLAAAAAAAAAPVADDDADDMLTLRASSDGDTGVLATSSLTRTRFVGGGAPAPPPPPAVDPTELARDDDDVPLVAMPSDSDEVRGRLRMSGGSGGEVYQDGFFVHHDSIALFVMCRLMHHLGNVFFDDTLANALRITDLCIFEQQA
ncbi:hypothetical protein BCR44DRAFT_1457032 [Catenaria anguillulae PL171]|uniref:Secreted protein n=1 Tax=Catenaria anguillulae PL171 TaxID=765915 RepID=A0A1Y2I7G7_9FUNG|nr:hypothetical protein BCR44DRAFT_1457032 [Catenaria anguillulae PL171]